MAKFLIIGATSGIGLALIRLLLTQEHQLFLTGRNSEKRAALENEFPLRVRALDATDFKAVETIFNHASEELGGLDGVVNCAGSLLLKSAHLTSLEEYQAVIASSLTTAFATVAAAGKHLHERGGSVVLISSAAALQGIANHEAIAAAKGGVISLARSAAASYADRNIRFNVVAPGLTNTSLTKFLIENPAALKMSSAMHALGRIGAPQDIARVIAFFLAPENNWITGQVLAVDGGLSRVLSKNRQTS
jgi:3-oxoacyl-[acyl-carrier protein] reductase